MTELRFEEARHHFYLDDVRIPSVTGVLKESGVIHFPPGLDLTEAIHRGKYVHAACDLWNKNDLDVETLDPKYAGYVQAWITFLRDTGAKVVTSENRVCSRKWRYAGILDDILAIKGKLTLVDIKTGARPDPSWQLQTAGYKVAWEENAEKISKRMAVQLRPDGTYKQDPHTDPGDVNQYLGFMAGYTWKLNKKIIRLAEDDNEE